MTNSEIKQKVANYVIDKLFEGKESNDFNNDTLLVSSRLLDSIVVLKMVNHFEELFNIEMSAHEVNVDNLDSVNKITEFISKKLAK